jgi:hypothetical protein
MKPFLIYIIESPSNDDLLLNQREGDSLSRILELCKIPNRLFTVIDIKSLENAIQIIKDDYIQTRKTRTGPLLPLIHLSCHGNDQQIGLSNGERLNYKVLLEEFSCIGSAFSDIDTINPLHISMSSCFGLYAINEDFKDRPSPFAILIGSENEIGWTDSLIAYAAFYNSFIYNDHDINQAMKCMNSSIGDERLFQIYRGKDLKQEIEKDRSK